MALGWDLAATMQLEQDVRPAILFHLETPEPLRLWTGAGDLQIDTDAVEDDADNIYWGIGLLAGVPEINEAINGIAQRTDFVLSGAGLSSEVTAIASGEAADVRGAVVSIGFLCFDRDWQIATPTMWREVGIADSLKIGRAPGENRSAIRTITLSVGSVFTGRKRPTPAFWTDQDQKRRSGDDRFCERRVTADASKFWPT